MESMGLDRNPVVDLLHKSGECLCGAFAAKDEIRDLEVWFPEVAERIHEPRARVDDAGRIGCVWGHRRDDVHLRPAASVQHPPPVFVLRGESAVRTTLKALPHWRRRRFKIHVSDCAREWERVVSDACSLDDPQSIELAVSIGVLMGVLLDRAVGLDEDVVEVTA